MWERLMPEHSDNKERGLYLTLNPLHDIVDLTGSQLGLLIITLRTKTCGLQLPCRTSGGTVSPPAI